MVIMISHDNCVVKSQRLRNTTLIDFICVFHLAFLLTFCLVLSLVFFLQKLTNLKKTFKKIKSIINFNHEK